MTNQSQITYNVDIVLCIDATSSMIPHIDRVKNNALKFHKDIIAQCSRTGRIINNLRIRVIGFRDLYEDDIALFSSPFYNLPGETDKFNKFVNDIGAIGGGPAPETGLEALAQAIKSDWQKEGERRRQIIVIFTDAPSHPLEKSGKKSNYPKGMPKNFDELTDLWDGQSSPIHPLFKRLLLFSPDDYPWTNISDYWEMTIHHPARAGQGLSDNDYEAILQAIVRSI